MAALLPDDYVDFVPQLVNFPVLTDLSRNAKHEYVNPFEFLRLRREHGSVLPVMADDGIGRLLDQIESDNLEARKWAVGTISSLYDGGLLDSAMSDRFGAALWDKLNDGLPADTDYKRFAFLVLPHPSDCDPEAAFRKWIASQDFPKQGRSKQFSINESITFCDEIIGASEHIKWSPGEVRSISQRVMSWWDTDKHHLRSTNEDVIHEFDRRFDALMRTVVAIVNPSSPMSSEEDTIKRDLKRLVDELRRNGLPTLRVEAACLHLFPVWREDLIRRIRDSIVCLAREAVDDALQAALIVARRVQSLDDITADFRNLVRCIGHVVLWRKEPGLVTAIDIMGLLIKQRLCVLDCDVEYSIHQGLASLIEDTAVQPLRDPLLGTEEHRWGVEEKIFVRQEAAYLAYELSRYYIERGEAVPDIVRKWEEICQSDSEFAEVRSQWIAKNVGIDSRAENGEG